LSGNCERKNFGTIFGKRLFQQNQKCSLTPIRYRFVTQRFQISGVGAVSIGNSSLRTGRVGRSYSARLSARSGKKPFTWSLVAGSLPLGLTLDSATGRITGTPSAGGDTNLTFQVTDTLGGIAQKALTLSIK
jgi:hypothetical protein